MSRRGYRPNRETGKAKTEVRGVFGELRRMGFIARMNFSCCSSCASYELGDRWDREPLKKGVVYYHRQNEEYYNECGCLTVHYFGGRTGDSREEASDKTKQVGDIVINLLAKRGMVYRWDGSPGSTIEVFDNLKLLEETEERERQRAEEAAQHVK